jgi:hypothetical protein
MSKRKSGERAAESPSPREKVGGDLVPTCEPLQIAELAKSETQNDGN